MNKDFARSHDLLRREKKLRFIFFFLQKGKYYMSNWENLDLCQQAVLSCGISNFSIPMKKKEEMSFGRATTNDRCI